MSDLNGSRVFVAGATGLAGSGVVRALLSAYPKVRIAAAHRSKDGAFIDDARVAYLQGDLRNDADCLSLSKDCVYAVMAAANTGGAQASRDKPWAQVTDNVVMDARMLEAFHRNGVRRVIYVSTASVYQPFEGFIREDQLDWNLDPHAAYLGVGWAKRYGEKACWFWRQKTGMEFAVLRLANVFGPYARFDPSASNFIAAIARKAVDRMDPFEVWGSADVTRDVVFADDFGRAVAAALAAPELGYEVFNIGSGVKTTVGDVVRWTIDESGHRPSEIRFSETAPETIQFRALDISKARDILGWAPLVGAEEGVRRTVAWWKGNRRTWTR